MCVRVFWGRGGDFFQLSLCVPVLLLTVHPRSPVTGKGASVASAGRPAADETPAWWHEISLQEVSEMMARVPAETAAKIAGSASHKGNFYAVLDREDMNRSGVFPNWLDAEYVKKSASGYGKYGTKQDCIEGALEELDTMIKHYNLICMKKLGNK